MVFKKAFFSGIRYLPTLFLLSALGCVSLPPQKPPAERAHPQADAQFPGRIAVLPVSNQAGNPDGAMLLRYLVVRKLHDDLAFIVPSPSEVDDIIQQRSFTGPEIPIQVTLAREDPKLLASWLNVDGMMHVELQSYSKAKVAFYQAAKVKAHFWLTDKTGKTLWESSKSSEETGIASGGAPLSGNIIGSDWPPAAVNAARDNDMAGPTVDLVDEAFETFPKK